MIEKSISVYKITNIINDYVYFGKSVDVKQRWWGHCYQARKGGGFYFHSAIRKYGPSNFKVTVVECNLTNDAASNLERLLIVTAKKDKKQGCYNIAKGGDGGHTMTKEQLESQYAIKPEQYDEYRQLFDEGLTVNQIAEKFGVSYNASRSCADRLGLSFTERRIQKSIERAKRLEELKLLPKKRKPRSEYKKPVYSDEYRRQKSELLKKLNRERGISEATKQDVLQLYHEQDMTAQEVADKLCISKGSVRATVNVAYAEMDPDEAAAKKKRHGSAVRRGSRNSNFGKYGKRGPYCKKRILDEVDK